MPGQKGLAPIVIILLIAAVVTSLGYFVISQGILKIPIVGNKAQEPVFNIKNEYENPFRSSTQNEDYVNPFDNLK